MVSGDDPIWPPVYRAWQTKQSYYALVEIIDAHLDPSFHRVSKADVERFLGSPNWGTVNQDTNRVWAYQGLGRHIPQQDKALFNFDTNGALTTIEWVSE